MIDTIKTCTFQRLGHTLSHGSPIEVVSGGFIRREKERERQRA